MVTYAQCRELVRQYAQRNPDTLDALDVTFQPCEGCLPRWTALMVFSYGSKHGGRYHFLLDFMQEEFGRYNPKRCAAAEHPVCACSRRSRLPGRRRAAAAHHLRRAVRGAPAKLLGQGTRGGAQLPHDPVRGEVSAMIKRISTARTIDWRSAAAPSSTARRTTAGRPMRRLLRRGAPRRAPRLHRHGRARRGVAAAAAAAPAAADAAAAAVPAVERVLQQLRRGPLRLGRRGRVPRRRQGSHLPPLCAYGTACRQCGPRLNPFDGSDAERARRPHNPDVAYVRRRRLVRVEQQRHLRGRRRRLVVRRRGNRRADGRRRRLRAPVRLRDRRDRLRRRRAHPAAAQRRLVHRRERLPAPGPAAAANVAAAAAAAQRAALSGVQQLLLRLLPAHRNRSRAAGPGHRPAHRKVHVRVPVLGHRGRVGIQARQRARRVQHDVRPDERRRLDRRPVLRRRLRQPRHLHHQVQSLLVGGRRGAVWL